MNIISPHDYIKALANLSKRITAKKFMLLGQEVENLELKKLEAEINDSFKEELRFGISEISNPDEISKYENRIDYEFSKITTQKLIKYPVEDEIELFRVAKISSRDYLKDFEIQIGEDKKGFFKKLKFNIPQVKSICRTADQVFIIPDNEGKMSDNILLMSKVKYANRDYNAFIHMYHGAQREGILSLGTFLILNNELTKNFNPIRCFLNILNWYGLLLRINNKTKKFFKEEKIIQSSLDGNMNIFEIVEGDAKSNFYVSSVIRKMNLYLQVKFAYGINESRYFKDLYDKKI